jgi:hypothetical protein
MPIDCVERFIKIAFFIERHIKQDLGIVNMAGTIAGNVIFGDDNNTQRKKH